MNPLLATALARMALALPATRGRGAGAGMVADQGALGSWLHPEVHWLLLAALLVALASLSAVVSMLAWSDTRRHHDIRSLNRRTFH